MLRERWPLWKAGLYDLEMISPRECNFRMSGLAYDTCTFNKDLLHCLPPFYLLFPWRNRYWNCDGHSDCSWDKWQLNLGLLSSLSWETLWVVLLDHELKMKNILFVINHFSLTANWDSSGELTTSIIYIRPNV